MYMSYVCINEKNNVYVLTAEQYTFVYSKTGSAKYYKIHMGGEIFSRLGNTTQNG